MKWLDDHWCQHRPLVHRCNKWCLPMCDYEGLTVNQSSHSGKWDAIVIHYTAGGHYLLSSHAWFKMPQAKASAHFILGRGGEIVQCVPLDKRAWHAGDGEMESINGEMINPNFCAIGIEIANHGLLDYIDGDWYYNVGDTKRLYNPARYGMPVRGCVVYDTGKKVDGWWAPYLNRQLVSLRMLVQRLIRVFGIPHNRIIGHQDTALPPGKKKDPGPLFPWGILKNLDGPIGNGKNLIRTRTEICDD